MAASHKLKASSKVLSIVHDRPPSRLEHSLGLSASIQQSNNQTQQSPSTELIQIIFDMGRAAGPGIDVYKGDFKPPITYQPMGTIVTWENKDDFLLNRHNVTSKDGLFDKDLSLGESFNYTFTKAGTYDYYCKYFPDMRGEIVIE